MRGTGMARRGRAVAMLAAAGLVGAVVAAAPAGAAAQALPPLDPSALQKSISGLPSAGITSALVDITGTAGAWSGASGLSDVAAGRPASPGERFRIGSVTKVFTATVVLHLVAEGRVELNDTIQDYLPGVLPADIPPVTVAELLNHTSGLPAGDAGDDEGDPAGFVAHRFDHPTPAQVVASIDGEPMSFAPGTAQQYNGINYYLLGMLIERVTGHTYADEVTDVVLGPLGLTQTTVPAATDFGIAGPHLHGYLTLTQNGESRLADVARQSPYPWAEGGMISSARDLDRLLTALFAGRLLPAAEVADMTTLPDVPYVGTNGDCKLGDPGRACFGMGLMRAIIGGVTVWGKTGSRPGYTDGVFATADLQRVMVYAFTPTDENATYSSFILGIAQAALG